jgi:hypothetical protein
LIGKLRDLGGDGSSGVPGALGQVVLSVGIDKWGCSGFSFWAFQLHVPREVTEPTIGFTFVAHSVCEV